MDDTPKRPVGRPRKWANKAEKEWDRRHRRKWELMHLQADLEWRRKLAQALSVAMRDGRVPEVLFDAEGEPLKYLEAWLLGKLD